MLRFAEACERVAATSKRLEKVAILAELLRSYPPDDARAAAVFLCGSALPQRDPRTLNVGRALLWRAVLEATGATEAELTAAYRAHGDLGAGAADLWPARESGGLRPSECARAFEELAAATRPAARLRLLAAILGASSALEAKYLLKILTSELRIGSKESLVHESIAAAFEVSVAAVHRADMLLGDVGETLELARTGRVESARLRLFHAVLPMLASPVASAEAAAERIPDALIEDKFDGIRAQAHACLGGQGRVRLFSRTADDVTAAFPELGPEIARFAGEVVLDGEILAWKDGRALPFSALQRRLGRKAPSEALRREVPVAFAVFDVLYAGELTIDEPLRVRRARLDGLFASRAASAATPPRQLALFEATGPAASGALVFLVPTFTLVPGASVEALFEAARARGNEGLMVKDPASPYTPGRRGKAWLKWKRELATLDVVVTAVELGHGKRAGVLSDYTFAVRDGERLVTIGKAYTGLTDAEIAELTTFFFEHTIEERGHLRVVEPLVVIEVAFNNMMETTRHPSGLALRFPRIVRRRPDKGVEEIDTLATARAIFERQKP